jgi:hypothetical protein
MPGSRLMMTFSGFIALGLYILFDFTWGESAVTYKQPIAAVRAKLATAEAPPLVFGSEYNKRFKLGQSDSQSVVWIVEDGGKEALRFIARLTPAGADATEVRIDVSGPTSGPFGDVQRRLSEYRSVRHMYVVAMKERVAATLGDRMYNWAVVAPTVAFATIANLTALSNQMDSAGQAFRQKDREAIRKAYANEAAGQGRR